MTDKLSDEWQTPADLFDELNKEFNFGLDLCATKENSKCQKYCTDYLNNRYNELGTEEFLEDGYLQFNDYDAPLSPDYYREDIVCWMNPPYSNPKPFIEKAWEDSQWCKIVCLLPNTIKTCKYMDIVDENNGLSTFRKWKSGLEIRDLTRRTAFNHPNKQSSSPSFGCMVIIMDRRGL